jgi:hypothetical protein
MNKFASVLTKGINILRDGRIFVTIGLALGIVLATALLTYNRLAVAADPSGQFGAKPAADAAPSTQKAAPTSEQKEQKEQPNGFPGYLLLAPMNSTLTYLADKDGKTVRVWQSAYTPALSAYLLENGHLLRSASAGGRGGGGGAGGGGGGGGMGGFIPGAGGRIQEFTFDGEIVWDYQYSVPTHLPHHDILKLPNGNVLMVVRETKTAQESLDAGRKPQAGGGGGGGGGVTESDFILEVKPTDKTSGEIVWQWHIWDHLIQDFDSNKANYGDVAAHPELIDVNCTGIPDAPQRGAGAGRGGMGGGGMGGGGFGGGMVFGGGSDWAHVNALAYNAELDQVMFTSYGLGEFYIIDHSTTTAEAAGHTGGRYGKGGDLLYRWGNPGSYRVTSVGQNLFCPHNAHWIPRGLPGEGHVLVFNNGVRRPEGNYSSVEELVLPVDKDGRYKLEPGKAVGPESPIWSYTAPVKTEMYSSTMSSAQRLPNGNTLICLGDSGVMMEVTAQKEVVWRYVNPDQGSRGMGGGGFGMGGRGQGGRGGGPVNPAAQPPGGNPPNAAPATQQQGTGGTTSTPPQDAAAATPPSSAEKTAAAPPASGAANPVPGAAPAPDAVAGGRGAAGARGGGGGARGGQIFRVHLYTADFPGLAGKELAPGKTVQEVMAERRQN